MYIPKKSFDVIETFPHEVEIIQHTWIKMKDGCRLSAKIWIPKTASSKPVPAVLEYIPYRKNDITSYRDSINHTYMAGHGFACVRVDLRGSGDSEGVLRDEYLQQELEDGIEVIEWISQQDWCSGNVGMMGKSWGGFNALQIAALQPKALKAIITVSSAHDRYSTDVHYMGGCLLGDNLSWASEMFAFNSCPPDPKIQGEAWRANWQKRMRESGMWLKQWLEHSYRDEYWKHGSVCEDYSQIKCPVFAISGWADGYSNTVFRLVENLNVPRLGLVGPWGHNYPHLGMPGPGLGFLQEAVDWWTQWLKEEETGIMDLPSLRVWMQESVSPSFTLERRPGHWVGIDQWPTKSTTAQSYNLNDGLLDENQNGETEPSLQSPLSVGLFAGKWCSFSSTPDLPHDQREEDGGALVFESPELETDLEIVGEPKVHLTLKSNQPVAMVVARLCDVGRDGKVARVTYGLLNLCHRESHENPQYLPVNKEVKATVCLNNVAQRFCRGHKLRLSLSTSYWPIAWPAPEPVRLTINNAKSSMELPVVTTPLQNYHNKYKPAGAPPLETNRIESQNYSWQVIRDLGKDKAILDVLKDEGRYQIPSVDIEVNRATHEKYSYSNDNLATLSGEVTTEREFIRAEQNWHTQIKTRSRLTSDSKNFYILADLDAFEGDKRVFSETWDYTVARKFI